ncbi:hypothetical protein pVco7_gp126 [Vibrio phage pVco-7]
MIKLVYPSTFVRFLPGNMLPHDTSYMGEEPLLGYYSKEAHDSIVEFYVNRGIPMELTNGD